MMMDRVVDKVATWCMRIAAGDPAALDDLADYCRRLGYPTERSAEEQLNIAGLVRTAVYLRQDPVTVAVCVNFALGGALWPHAGPFSRILGRVKELWKDPGLKAFAPGAEPPELQEVTSPPIQPALFGMEDPRGPS